MIHRWIVLGTAVVIASFVFGALSAPVPGGMAREAPTPQGYWSASSRSGGAPRSSTGGVREGRTAPAPPGSAATGGNLSRAAWLELTTPTAPTVGGTFVGRLPMAPDPSLGAVVYLDEQGRTWLFENGTWSVLNVSGPPARYNALLAYDPAEGTLLLFGGETGSGQYLNDTWEFHRTTWTNVTDPQRAPSAMLALGGFPPPDFGWAYDPSSRAMVLLESSWTSVGTPYETTWEFQGVNWTQDRSPGSMPPRIEFAYATDPALDGVVLYGGEDTLSDLPSSEMWLFTNSSWQKLGYTGPSPPDLNGSMSYDPRYGALIETGGNNASTWAFSNDTWTSLSENVFPSARGGPALTFDPATGNLVLFGGMSALASPLNDTWMWGTGVVTVAADPPGDGTLTVGTTSASDPELVEMPLGVVRWSVTTLPGAYFDSLEVTGALRVASSSNSSGELTVLGNATLTATFSLGVYLTVDVDPSRCGPVAVGPFELTNGSVARPRAGSYPIAAPGCTGMTFGHWNVSGALNLSDPSAATGGSVTVRGNGSLQAMYGAEVAIAVDPVGSGAVQIDGTGYPGGSQVELLVGAHAIELLPAPGFSNSSLVPGGGFLTLRGTDLVVEGPGTVWGGFTPLPSIQVTVTPPACGPVWIDGAAVDSGGAYAFPYHHPLPISAAMCAITSPDGAPAFVFHQWLVGGPISVGQPTAWNTTFVGAGDGTIAAEYISAGLIHWTISPPLAGVVSLNGTWNESSGGSSLLALGKYTVQWVPTQGTNPAPTGPLAWDTSGNVSLSGDLLTVWGAGSVTLTLAGPPSKQGGGVAGPTGAYVVVSVAVIAVGVALWLRSRPPSPEPVAPSEGQPPSTDWGLGEPRRSPAQNRSR